MASKRNLYQNLATESVTNARWFLADAKRLRRAGSRGHGAAFAVLSIEESSKSLIYRLVAEGVLRIVRKNPNHITTFTKNELLNHQFKQQVLANAFGEYLRYGPFYEAAESLRKQKFSKTEVRELFLRAVHAHRIMQVDLRSGGRATQEVQRLGSLLDRLNDLKNRGLTMSIIHREGYRRRRTRERGTSEKFWISRKAHSRSQVRPCTEAIRIARNSCREKQTRPSSPLSGELNGGPTRKGKGQVGDMNNGPVSVELKY